MNLALGKLGAARFSPQPSCPVFRSIRSSENSRCLRQQEREQKGPHSLVGAYLNQKAAASCPDSFMVRLRTADATGSARSIQSIRWMQVEMGQSLSLGLHNGEQAYMSDRPFPSERINTAIWRYQQRQMSLTNRHLTLLTKSKNSNSTSTPAGIRLR
ncbi:uncharacterized protein UDID_19418 [Ustilago sp. UG-2017a]|nr:uncharacterized protein UDID_19418 [Ustilago sp. UG-2017a]